MLPFLLTIVETGFISSIISLQEITESSIILSKNLRFLQLHVAGFQIKSFLYPRRFFGLLHSHQHLSLFHFLL